MIYSLFWTLVIATAIAAASWVAGWLSVEQEFDMGAKACREGQPLNPGWSRHMKAGWGHEWRAMRGLNDLAEEIRKVKP